MRFTTVVKCASNVSPFHSVVWRFASTHPRWPFTNPMAGSLHKWITSQELDHVSDTKSDTTFELKQPLPFDHWHILTYCHLWSEIFGTWAPTFKLNRWGTSGQAVLKGWCGHCLDVRLHTALINFDFGDEKVEVSKASHSVIYCSPSEARLCSCNLCKCQTSNTKVKPQASCIFLVNQWKAYKGSPHSKTDWAIAFLGDPIHFQCLAHFTTSKLSTCRILWYAVFEIPSIWYKLKGIWWNIVTWSKLTFTYNILYLLYDLLSGWDTFLTKGYG